jgi:hypothetical protein
MMYSRLLGVATATAAAAAAQAAPLVGPADAPLAAGRVPSAWGHSHRPEPLLQPAAAATPSAAASPTTECFRVTDYGAVGRPSHDDTRAFQKAADAAASVGGGCVRVPSAPRGGGYVLTSTVTLAPGVRLIGAAAGFPEVPHEFGPPVSSRTGPLWLEWGLWAVLCLFRGGGRRLTRSTAGIMWQGDLNTTGGSRIFARITTPRAPLFAISQGCAIKGLYIHYDTMPWPTDAEFADPESPCQLRLHISVYLPKAKG